jgi:YD repeat-containing protein
MNKFIPIFILLLCACKSRTEKNQENIIGAWKTDTVYHYTNGFVQVIPVTDSDENIEYDYDKAGNLTMKKDGEKRTIRYELISEDSLAYFDKANRMLTGFQIISLNQNQLVLKKNQPPVFPGKNQITYDIRHFSHPKAQE